MKNNIIIKIGDDTTKKDEGIVNLNILEYFGPRIPI